MSKELRCSARAIGAIPANPEAIDHLRQKLAAYLGQIGQSGGKEGLRFSRCDASPSRTSAPLKPSISSAVDVSKRGPLTRSQLLSAYLVQRIALCAPLARSCAVSSATLCKSASSTQSDTNPIRSASSPDNGLQVSK